ncbi:MAG: YicC/YloC family endoribonuclease [Bacillota bacterium]
MLRSMTGYGQVQLECDGYDITVEIKSVNHKYQKIYLHLPDQLSALEPQINQMIKNKIARGKLNYNLEVSRTEESQLEVRLNELAAQEYIDSLVKLKEKFDLAGQLDVNLLAQFTDVLEVEEVAEDLDALWPKIKEGTEAALDELIKMRNQEGQKLLTDLEHRAAEIDELIAQIETRVPEMVTEYQKQLSSRVEDLLADAEVDQDRLANEVAVIADKSDVSEELVRMKSHLEQFQSTLESNITEPVGKKLDFIAQEMHREVNTIGAKINDSEVSSYVIDLKSAVDKIREQVRNVE